MNRIATIGFAMAAILAAVPALAKGDGDNMRSERTRTEAYSVDVARTRAQDAAANNAQASRPAASSRDSATTRSEEAREASPAAVTPSGSN